jgi:prepilin peptidase CpaA
MIALAVAFTASVTDIRSRRIPNVLTFGAAIGAFCLQGFIGGPEGLRLALFGWLVGAAIFFVPFALGGLGAGDVKLLAALGALLGPREALWLALYTGISGGVMALAVALMHGYLRQALSNVRLLLMHWRVAGLCPLHEVTLAGGTGPRLAYATSIFAGLVATIWLQ